LSAKLAPTFAARGYHSVSVTDPYGRILGFLDRFHIFYVNISNNIHRNKEVFPVVWYGHGSLSLTPKERIDCGYLRTVLRISEPNISLVTGNERKLHSEEFCNLYS
jgi:hypothetical protein